MQKRHAVTFVMCLAFLAYTVVRLHGQTNPPLTFTHAIPVDIKGHFDHLGVDVKGNRLFSCAEAQGKLEIFNLRTGEHLHTIDGVKTPHEVRYLEDVNRIYVVEGHDEFGSLSIYNGKDYSFVKRLELNPDADSMTYDPSTKYLYVTSNGDVMKRSYSTIAIIDTRADKQAGEIKVEGDSIGGIALDASSSIIYLGNKSTNEIDVIDLNTKATIAHWPLTLGKHTAPLVLDVPTNRLFVGCTSGHLVIFDTQTGKELQALPINKEIDDLSYDPASKRLYANCAGVTDAEFGTVDVYQQTDSDRYKLIAQVQTKRGASNGMLVPEIGKYFVEVPQHQPGYAKSNDHAEILVYEVHCPDCAGRTRARRARAGGGR